MINLYRLLPNVLLDQSQYGWHVIKVEDRRQKPPPSFDEVKDRLVGSMVQSRAQDTVTKFRSTAKIDYVDPELKKMAEEDAQKQAEFQKKMEEQMKEAPPKDK